MKQRKTQTAEYWQKQFQVGDKEISIVYQSILDQNQPVSIDDLSVMLVAYHCEEEERAARTELQEGRLYQPKESYSVDETLIFPALDFAVGKVVDTRAGSHPDYNTFAVISVAFGAGGPQRNFVANFGYDHPLNAVDHSLTNLQGLLSPAELYRANYPAISSKVAETLDHNEDFVRFQDKYFLGDALPEFHEGMFNIADAAIDINQGPLGIDALVQQMGLVENKQDISDILRFSVNYRLANDERFADVGPTGQVHWYLRRIEPPEVNHPPRRLRVPQQSYDPSLLDDDLYDILAEIDDEATMAEDGPPVEPDAKSITLVLNYPHWRVGTLPLTPRTRPFFPASQYNPVLFEFIDGQTGNTFPGWTVNSHDYVFGLDRWYKKHKLPVGAYIILKRTDDSMKVIVDYEATRTQRDWVRMAQVVNHQLSFQMNPAAINCKYDELMIISDPSAEKTDRLWVNSEEKEISVYEMLCKIFPELSKLNPQSTVHAKTLYSALNVIRRVSPGIVFQELVSHQCFIPMNHGYWTFDPNLKD